MNNEKKIKERLGLSRKEFEVFKYIEKACQKNGGKIAESNDDIGEKLNISGATVYRAIAKMKNAGVVAIVAASDKMSPNEIIFYGYKEDDVGMSEVIETANNLSASLTRIQSLLNAKDNKIHDLEKELQKEREKNEEINNLLLEAKNYIETLSTVVQQYELDADSTLVNIKKIEPNRVALIYEVNNQ